MPTPFLPPEQSEQIEALLQQMTLPEKIGQMTQPEKNSVTPQAVTDYAIGSVLSGGGGTPAQNTPTGWAAMVREYADAALQTRLGIPLVYGVDAVHGHNNVYGAVLFPHNIALGAADDETLVEQIAAITAKEILATNVHWNFAPALSVPRDFRWGRTYEGYSEDPQRVSNLGAAYVRGLQGATNGHITALATAKHFVGDGGTTWGSTNRYPHLGIMWQSLMPDRWQIDQGDTQIDESALRQIHMSPYPASIDAGALSVMASYSSWNGDKMHGHKRLLTDVLKGELGFAGFVVSDWQAIDQLSPDYYTCVVQSINAGLDMIMVPFDYVRFIETLTQAVEQGDIPQARIDDAVRRILRAKVQLGLFENPLPDATALQNDFGGEAHRAVARQAVQKSLVLLKQEKDALPLPKDAPTILVAGRGADDMGLQCGGWSIEWQGVYGDITPGTTILEGIRKAVSAETQVVYAGRGMFPQQERAPIGIAVIGEAPYAEGEGDRASLAISEQDVRVVDRVRVQCDMLVVVLLCGRPMVIESVLPQADAFVVAWLPGTEGAGVADVLFGDVPFTGKLPYTWIRDMTQLPLGSSSDDPLFPLGYGLALDK